MIDNGNEATRALTRRALDENIATLAAHLKTKMYCISYITYSGSERSGHALLGLMEFVPEGSAQSIAGTDNSELLDVVWDKHMPTEDEGRWHYTLEYARGSVLKLGEAIMRQAMDVCGYRYWWEVNEAVKGIISVQPSGVCRMQFTRIQEHKEQHVLSLGQQEE